MVKKSQSELTTLFQLLSEQYILKKEALTFKESAIYSRISPSRLNTLTTNGEITHYVPYPGRVVFQKKDLDNFLLQNKKYVLQEAEKNYNYRGGISYE